MTRKSYKVLLVDDSKTDYFLADHYLSAYEGCSFELDWIDNYDAGLEHALKDDYDFYLLDYRLERRRTGLELARELKAKGSDAPIFMYSGEKTAAFEQSIAEEEIAGFISKYNLSTESIIEELKTVLGELECPLQKQLPEYVREVRDPLVAFDKDGRVVLANDSFKKYNFAPQKELDGLHVSILFNAPGLEKIDHKTAADNRVFTTRVHITPHDYHRIVWNLIPVDLPDSPDIFFVAKGVLQRKVRKKRYVKQNKMLQWVSKIFRNPQYVNINNNLYDRDIFM